MLKVVVSFGVNNHDKHPRKMKSQPDVIDLIATARWPAPNPFYDLLTVALEAMRFNPPWYFSSIFGTPRSWLPPHHSYSEYNIISPWQPLTTARYLLDISLPSTARSTPDLARLLLPPVVNRRFWRPTHFFRQPDEYGGDSSFPGEHWFFINGIATNEDVARLNAAYLAHLFHRPLTVIQNSTNSLPCDLYECAIGKGLKPNPDATDRDTMTEPAWRATTAILEALNAGHNRRVVVIAHSQGTIIAANVLRAITKVLRDKLARSNNPQWHPFTNQMMVEVKTGTQKILRDNLAHAFSSFARGGVKPALRRLEKLEMYTFANCADKMKYVYPNQQLPYLEHFANERDLVARLGVLSPLRGQGAQIDIDGPVYEQKGAWGHLLNQHYLMPIDDHLYPGGKKFRHERNPFPGPAKVDISPRLYRYFHGKHPVASA